MSSLSTETDKWGGTGCSQGRGASCWQFRTQLKWRISNGFPCGVASSGSTLVRLSFNNYTAELSDMCHVSKFKYVDLKVKLNYKRLEEGPHNILENDILLWFKPHLEWCRVVWAWFKIYSKCGFCLCFQWVKIQLILHLLALGVRS